MEDIMNTALNIFNRLESKPFGRSLFSKILCIKAPYFGTIKPRFEELKPGHCAISMKKRRAVTNHLGTVHAIAMANLCELSGGTCIEVTLPGHLRWIAKSMDIEYLKIARTNLRSSCDIDVTKWEAGKDYPVTVHVIDKNDIEVVRAVITMYVSERKTGNVKG